MSKYLVETYYNCTFKIQHQLNELNDSELENLENRNDGKVEIIEIRLNNRKTKTIDGELKNPGKIKDFHEKDINISKVINEQITNNKQAQKLTDTQIVNVPGRVNWSCKCC